MKDDKGDDAQGTKVTDIGDTDTNGFNFTNTYVQEAVPVQTNDPRSRLHKLWIFKCI